MRETHFTHQDSISHSKNRHSEASAAWDRLNQEALAAHLAFVNAARGAAVARHRGEHRRALALTQLARKQHTRWVNASNRVPSFDDPQ